MARFGIDWKLPNDWIKAALSEVAEINPSYRVKEEELSDSDIPFVPMASVPERGGVLEEFEWRSWQQVKSGKTRFREGDTLFAKITPCTENGKVAFIESLPMPVGFGSTEFYVISPGERLVPKFLFYFLRTQWVRDNAIGTMIGTTNRQRVPSGFFRELEIPLPPLSEQARIVAKLERIERARRAQKQAIEQTQALLKAALAQVFDTKDGLPEGWTKAYASEIANINPTYRIAEEDLAEDKLPFVPMVLVPEGGGVLEEFEWRSWQQARSGKTRFREGDTLFAKITPCTENGKVAFVESLPMPVGFGSTEFHVLSPREQVHPRFLFHFLRTELVREQAVASMTGTTGRQRVPASVFEKIEIPLPPLPVQQRIVAKLDRIQRALRLQREALQKIDALMQTALYRAFRGEL